jgi:hypothetical protein
MAEAITLYSTKNPSENSVSNDDLKTKVRTIIDEMGLGKEKPEGSKVKGTAELRFDRSARAFQIVTDGVTKKDMTELLSKTQFARTPEAENAWAAEKADLEARQDLMRSEALKRQSTTKEPGPAVDRARAEKAQIEAGATRYVMYRTPADKGEMVELLKQIDAKAHYHPNAKDDAGNKHPHFSVVTAAPGVEKLFAKFMGKTAMERMYAHQPEQTQAPAAKATEALRSEVRKGGAMMANFGKSGMPLYANSDEKWVGMADNATPAQLTSIRQTTARQLASYIDKELKARSESSGMSVDQLKEIVASKGKAELKNHGTGLVGADIGRKQAYERGLAALDKYLEGRGIVSKESRKEAGAEVAPEGKKAERPQEQARSAAKGNDISSEESSIEAIAVLNNRRRGGASR